MVSFAPITLRLLGILIFRSWAYLKTYCRNTSCALNVI